jgi:hypothetical protein
VVGAETGVGVSSQESIHQLVRASSSPEERILAEYCPADMGTSIASSHFLH